MKKRDKSEKRPFIIQSILSVIVVVIMVARFLRADFHTVFLCALTLLLFTIPTFVDKKLNIEVPRSLRIVIIFFIFNAEILGEIGSFYTYIPWWDTMLHTVNGFLMAAIGFSLIEILNDSPKFHFNLSPVFVAFVAFCFSMTVGVLWEFFEFAMDMLVKTDMQKDTVLSGISSVFLHPDGINDVILVPNISDTIINYIHNGKPVQQVISGGYLDTGLIDTMSDLIVNCIGAFVFSVIGYFYIKLKGKTKTNIASSFIPRLKSEE